MSINDYNRCLQSMYSLRRFGIKLGLDTINALLAHLGNPQRHLPCIHIAGTNGKGSVAAMLTAILMAAGYRVGRYTSPHLVRFNERISIDDQPIDDAQVVDGYHRIKACNSLQRQPTFFEFATAMALDAFARNRVDWAIIETGMGGRLDATNTIAPAACVITNISIEHKDYLGTTITAIAGEKAGIIKPGTPVISAVSQPAARNVIADTARRAGARLYLKGRDFKTRHNQSGGFSFYGTHHKWPDLKTGLQGDHQLENAAVAAATCDALNHADRISVSVEHVRKGLAQARWPGRLEVAAHHPLIILDGAHNKMAARYLSRYLVQELANRSITLVVGILDDKPYRSILNDLATPCDRIIVTAPQINRALPVQALAKALKPLGKSIRRIDRVDQAVRYAIETANKNDAICIAGSLYVVGEAKSAIAEMGIGDAAGPNLPVG